MREMRLNRCRYGGEEFWLEPGTQVSFLLPHITPCLTLVSVHYLYLEVFVCFLGRLFFPD